MAKLAEQKQIYRGLAKLAESILGQRVMSGRKVIYNKWGKNEVFDELVIYYC